MTREEIDLVFELAHDSVSLDGFLKQFRGGRNQLSLVQELLDEAIASRSPLDVECALIVGFRCGLLEEHVNALCYLATALWHERHEDVVMALSKTRSPVAIDTLKEVIAIRASFKYLAHDGGLSLARKALWGLGNIGNDKAIRTIKEIQTANTDEIMRLYIDEQLARFS